MANVSYQAKARFTEMKTGMLLHTPFFASLMLDTMTLKLGKFRGVDTAGTDGRTIWFDEDFLASLSLPEAVFLCCHEIGHAMFLHMERGRRYMDMGFDGKPFIPALFNDAADYVINDMLVKSKVGDMPKGGLIDKRFTNDMLVDDVYRELLKEQPPQGGKGQDQGDGDGEGGEGGEGETPEDASDGSRPSKGQMDTHVYSPAKLPEAEMKRAIQSAANQAKSMGKMPAALARFVEEYLQPKITWKERLRHLVTRTAERDSTTWSSPHRRRLVTQKVYMPSYTGFGAGTVVMAVDTSGSMGQREFDVAYAETGDILMTCKPEALYLMACDAEVHDVHQLAAYTDVYQEKPSMTGGGGTSFLPVFEKVEEMGITPAVLLYFTDGYGAFPDHAPEYPVIWIMTTDHEVPWGEAIRVTVNDYE